MPTRLLRIAFVSSAVLLYACGELPTHHGADRISTAPAAVFSQDTVVQVTGTAEGASTTETAEGECLAGGGGTLGGGSRSCED
jgi:hypothetical protein